MNTDNDTPPPPKPKASIIMLKPGRHRKNAYVRQAQSEGKKLTAWMFEQCDKAANFREHLTD